MAITIKPTAYRSGLPVVVIEAYGRLGELASAFKEFRKYHVGTLLEAAEQFNKVIGERKFYNR